MQGVVRPDGTTISLIGAGHGQITRICCSGLKHGGIRSGFHILLLPGEEVVVAFNSELGADGARLASGAFALAGLTGGASDTRAFSRGRIGHGRPNAERAKGKQPFYNDRNGAMEYEYGVWWKSRSGGGGGGGQPEKKLG